ncbi:hypothetical protein COCON_G00025400 [Conger conger]|uniref:Uncharacterized protein n=1 Tax=Conger conger TaxID=82655 RepID=A0A9Q1DXK3_CONCO|nr:hypothetical protein COCON_G00025400 [Conger conger]
MKNDCNITSPGITLFSRLIVTGLCIGKAMAGAVAMASVTEDFETQSNILDYFGKTSPAERKKDSASEQSKEDGSKALESPGDAEIPAKPPKPQGLRRGRRRGRPSKLSVSAEDGHAETPPPACEVSESSCSSDGVAVLGDQGLLGSETAALLAQISRDVRVADEPPSGAESAPTSTPPHAGENPKKRSSDEPHQEEGPGSPTQPVEQASPGDKRNKAKPARKAKSLQKQGSPEAPEANGSLCDTSLEGKADEAPLLNNSTIVISFEDFVQSQSQADSSASVETPESKAEVLGTPPSAEGEPGPSRLVSPPNSHRPGRGARRLPSARTGPVFGQEAGVHLHTEARE